jgi:hypothetical protein
MAVFKLKNVPAILVRQVQNKLATVALGCEQK